METQFFIKAGPDHAEENTRHLSPKNNLRTFCVLYTFAVLFKTTLPIVPFQFQYCTSIHLYLTFLEKTFSLFFLITFFTNEDYFFVITSNRISREFSYLLLIALVERIFLHLLLISLVEKIFSYLLLIALVEQFSILTVTLMLESQDSFWKSFRCCAWTFGLIL